MSRSVDTHLMVAFMTAAVVVTASPTFGQENSASAYRAVLDRYCVTCHNERRPTANLALDTVDLNQLGRDAEVWEKVLQKLSTQAMPPGRRPRPEEATYDAFSLWLEQGLDAVAVINPNPGRPTIHRLNQLEYTNAIRDLLALEIDGESLLPADELAYGFDNNADILTVAPGVLERYMSAARKISKLAVADPSIQEDIVRYSVSKLLAQDDRLGEEFPFGSRGGIAVRHHFPLDGEYVLNLESYKSGSRARGNNNDPQEIDVRLDGERLALFRVGSWPADDDQVELSEIVDTGEPLQVRFFARSGTHVVSVSFVKRTHATEGVGPERLPLWVFRTGPEFSLPMALDNIEIGGPYRPATLLNSQATIGNSQSRRRIFSCRPLSSEKEEPCAAEILTKLAERAFRRPVSAEVDVIPLMSLFRNGRAEATFDAGIQLALESILVDPEFLFRIERDPADVLPSTAYRLTDVEIASRLSFFLWGSIPDEELLNAASSGRLSDPVVFEKQVRRMLLDQRSTVLVNSFAAQWLHLRRMRSVVPDVNAFPDFDENLRNALVRETELFVESQIREDRSVGDLLTADYTFVNERLARHYGMSGIYGSRFRRVSLPGDARRGLLGHGSILTVTSHATRTSPVVRGKWVLENILGAPPPPPPPDVPPLPDREEVNVVMSMRERMEEHRANPVCASCHERMDPIGFALENFDAVGKWREFEGGLAIDTSGRLPDGTLFSGLADLRNVLLARQDEFVITVTEKLLTYALGRGIEYYDLPAIRAIVREAEVDDYRWSTLVMGVAKSLPFQMRRSEP